MLNNEAAIRLSVMRYMFNQGSEEGHSMVGRVVRCRGGGRRGARDGSHVGLVALRDVADHADHDAEVFADLGPVTTRGIVAEAQHIYQGRQRVVDVTHVVHQVVRQLVRFNYRLAVALKHLVVLEATEVASLGDGVDSGNHGLERVAEILVLLHIDLGHERLEAAVERREVPEADARVLRLSANRVVEE